MRLEELWAFDRSYEGHRYGIEFEVSGPKLPKTNTALWTWKPDGSVPRGLEYVSNGPFNIVDLRSRLEALKGQLVAFEAQIVPETACSTHVHMNVQDLPVRTIVAIMAAYYILEDMLVDYCGPDRVGNLFCLRLSDSSAPVDSVIQTINSRTFPAHIRGDHLRYAALNITSMATFGTLEFRAMRGIEADPLEVEDWVRILHAIKIYAMGCGNASTVFEEFSRRGPEDFVNRVLGNRLRRLVYTNPVVHDESMYQAVSVAQWLAYDIKWDRLEKKKKTATHRDIVRAMDEWAQPRFIVE
jgi:hypothetical protein